MTTSVTAAQIAQLRRMAAEPLTTTYSDALLTTYIETYPIPDGEGHFPGEEDEDYWTPTYDLHAAAADIWDEKAAAVADRHDFSADGGSYNRSQVYDQAIKQARYHRARRAPATATLRKRPRELHAEDFPWIGNLPESD